MAQSRSAMAESAVKLNVYQIDTPAEDAEGKAEAKSAEQAPVAESEGTPEPVKRQAPAKSAEQERDLSEIVKKWSKG
jgi:hypothetical protein